MAIRPYPSSRLGPRYTKRKERGPVKHIATALGTRVGGRLDLAGHTERTLHIRGWSRIQPKLSILNRQARLSELQDAPIHIERSCHGFDGRDCRPRLDLHLLSRTHGWWSRRGRDCRIREDDPNHRQERPTDHPRRLFLHKVTWDFCGRITSWRW